MIASEYARALATDASILGGKVTLWLLPFKAHHAIMVNAEFQDELSGELPFAAQVFVLLEGHLVDISIEDEDDPVLMGLAVWWGARNKTLRERFQIFSRVVSQDIYPALIRAYSDTRRKPPAADPQLRPPESADPE